MDLRALRHYQARCALCGQPTNGECDNGCETTQLNRALEGAETQWLKTWREQTRLDNLDVLKISNTNSSIENG